MKILIVAATELECRFLGNYCVPRENLPGLKTYALGNIQIDCCICGIGSPLMAYHLTKALHNKNKKYDFALNIGIAGSFGKFEVGVVVNVVRDEFGDLGFEDENGFNTLFDEGFLDSTKIPFAGGKLSPNCEIRSKTLQSLPKATAITVNKTTTYSKTIGMLVRKFNPDVETMEGASFFYVCMGEKVPCMQIRSISNKVGIREKSKWDIPLALANLEKTIIDFINELYGQ